MKIYEQQWEQQVEIPEEELLLLYYNSLWNNKTL